MIYYTYHIYWENTNKHYYGVRGTNDLPENDLFVKYFTSSKYVKEHIQKHGNPTLIEVRKTFNHREDAYSWESKVLKKINARKRDDYLNRFDGTYNGAPGPKTDEHKAKIKEKRKHQIMRKGFEWPEKVKEKISKTRNEKIKSGEIIFSSPNHSGENNPMYGKSQSKDAKDKISKAQKERMSNLNNRPFGEKNGMYGKSLSPETKKKLRESKKNRKWYNDGKRSILLNIEDKIPNGFKEGRIISKRRTKDELSSMQQRNK